MVNPLINEIRKTKPQMYSELDGILGSLALYMNNAYLSSDETELTNIFHRKAYLQDHFYYIVNPVDSSKCCFLTYPPSGTVIVSTEVAQTQPQTQKQTQVQAQQAQIPVLTNTPLRLMKNSETTFSPIFTDWDTEFTYFKPEEIIPFLACQVIANQKSIPALMKLGMAKVNSSPLGTGNTQNLAQSVPLNGNELEVLSSVCIIDSSHHSVGITNSTFCGQNGESFLTNLVENLIEADGFRRKNRTVVNFHERSFLNLERIHIPFLFPAGMKLPAFFKEHLSDANGFNERSVNFGEYERTINGDEIDSIFKYFVQNELGMPPSIGICAVECRNWARNLLISDLEPILLKAVLNSANLSLVFCNTLGTSKAETCEAFKSFCQTKSWNVLKLRKSDNNNNKEFVLERYFPEMNFLSDAVLNCIVLELNVINS